MAKILRQGKTPEWGTGVKFEGLIIDSFNISPELKDYEQTDENGAVCGYLVYDQTVNYDFSGTILKNDNGLLFESDLHPQKIGEVLTAITGIDQTIYANCEINMPFTVVLKSFNVSRSAGSAATFSATATGYDFSSQD